jgi:beta-mannosidase
MKKLFILLFFFAFNHCLKSQTFEKLIADNWFFCENKTDNWHKAKVPGCQYTDLMSNNLIPDPFYADNEVKLDTLNRKNWNYKCNFNVSDTFLSKKNVILRFEGLDTHCDIYLNNKFLGTTDNMFRVWEFHVEKYLKPDSNILLLVFTSPVIKDSLNALKLPYSLPDSRAFSRKAQYQYGWDWGPKLLTTGIWKPVKLIAYDNIRVEDVFFNQLNINSKSAELQLEIELSSEKNNRLWIELIDNNSNSRILLKKIKITKGKNIIKLPYNIENPILWMPNGTGNPYLYNFGLLIKRNQGTVYEKNFEIGLRKIELIKEKDSIGESFYFKVNSKPVFIKGANYVPLHSFPTEVTNNDYEDIIEKAKNANMNMLRVWGGGIYENDYFYSLCNRNGILVWQDFMFACNMYPGDSNFIENVENEAIDNIKRLRNNACIALWCGNNEIDEGWHNWGWQKQFNYTELDSIKIWNDYKYLFDNILPRTIKKLNLKSDYISSSPKFGWGRKESMTHGDSHYWGVWWGMEPFEKYIEKTGRFMSEYGFQSFPQISTLKRVIDDTALYFYSPQLKNHQKHPTGFETIDEYLKRDYKKSADLALYVYVSQLLQARGMKIAIGSHRRAMPRCMGTLYWQLNDCWPVVSWSSVDFYKNPKALYFTAKKMFESVILSFNENEKIQLWVISDNKAFDKNKLIIKQIDFDGNLLWDTILPNIKIKENFSEKIWENDTTAFKLNKYKNNSLLVAELWDEDSIICRELYFFASPKNLELKKPEINISTKRIAIDKAVITLQSNILAKDIMLESIENTEFSDNFFDLLPGEKKEIIIKSTNIGNALRSLNITDLSDIEN